MNIQIKVDEYVKAKLYIKLKPSKRNMYRQYIYDLLFNYNIIIKVNEYLKLKPPKMNL